MDPFLELGVDCSLLNLLSSVQGQTIAEYTIDYWRSVWSSRGQSVTSI
jgi:hypothetical protein